MSFNYDPGALNLSISSGQGTVYSGTDPAGSRPAPDKYDVEWFSSMVEKPMRDEQVSVPDKIISGLTNSSQELQKLSETASGDLLKAAKSGDPQDILEASRSMSSFYLQSLLTAKLVSKGSQAIEKLTNLQ